MGAPDLPDGTLDLRLLPWGATLADVLAIVRRLGAAVDRRGNLWRCYYGGITPSRVEGVSHGDHKAAPRNLHQWARRLMGHVIGTAPGGVGPLLAADAVAEQRNVAEERRRAEERARNEAKARAASVRAEEQARREREAAPLARPAPEPVPATPKEETVPNVLPEHKREKRRLVDLLYREQARLRLNDYEASSLCGLSITTWEKWRVSDRPIGVAVDRLREWLDVLKSMETPAAAPAPAAPVSLPPPAVVAKPPPPPPAAPASVVRMGGFALDLAQLDDVAILALHSALTAEVLRRAKR